MSPFSCKHQICHWWWSHFMRCENIHFEMYVTFFLESPLQRWEQRMQRGPPPDCRGRQTLCSAGCCRRNREGREWRRTCIRPGVYKNLISCIYIYIWLPPFLVPLHNNSRKKQLEKIKIYSCSLELRSELYSCVSNHQQLDLTFS